MTTCVERFVFRCGITSAVTGIVFGGVVVRFFFFVCVSVGGPRGSNLTMLVGLETEDEETGRAVRNKIGSLLSEKQFRRFLRPTGTLVRVGTVSASNWGHLDHPKHDCSS